MKFMFKTKVLSLVVLLGLAASAQAQKKFDQLEFPELRSYKAPQVETFKTKNGIRFYLLENKELPLISLNLTVRGGDIQTTDEKVGLAGILGDVMRSGGSKSYPSDKLNELLENKAASIETFMGFSSGGARMSVLKEDFDALLPVFMDVLMNPNFPDDKIELSKKQTKSGITRRNDDAEGIAYREFDQLIYGKNSVYSRFAEMATIDAITRDDIVAYHNNVFVGSNMYIGVIGDFDVKKMKKALEKAFAKIPKGKENKIVYPKVDYTFKNSINFVNKTDVNQSVVLLGHIGGKRNDDYAALNLMNEILSGGFSGRLMQTVRTDMGLAYGVFGSFSQGINFDGQFYAGVMTKSESTAAAISAIIDQIKKLQNETVTEKELKDAKDRILNSTVFRYDSRSKVLNERISNEYNGLPADYFEKYIDMIKKASIADIQRVAKNYLKPETLEILVVGNKNELGDQLSTFGTVNEIDITIPIPGMEKKTASGDTEMAKKVVLAMKNTLIASADVMGYSAETEETQFNEMIPGGKMTISNKSDVSIAEDKIESEMSMPQGIIKLSISGSEGTMSMGQMNRPLAPAQIEGIKKEMKRTPLYVALHIDELDMVYTGEEKMEGKVFSVIQFNSEPQFTLLIDKSTSLPEYVRYSQLNPQTGEVSDVTVQYSDWKDANGVKYAGKISTMVVDKVVSETIIKSWKAN
ncbi:insulinase family protein [bacterium]|nr:MAG: insulinase family protein [bacterium]